MGMEMEMNWYLVSKKQPNEITEGYMDYDDEGNEIGMVDTRYFYRVVKDGARIYPIGNVVPLIVAEEANALVYITEVSHRLDAKGKPITVVEFEVTLELDAVTKKHYTDMYRAYKERQEALDNGGRFRPEQFVNAMERANFEEVLAKTGWE